MAGRGKANAIDARVGFRLRVRRMTLGMSQEELGRGIHVAFQQIQKFEAGTNRINAGYLFRMANILTVPVSYFFDEMAHAPRSSQPAAPLQRFLMSAEGLSLWRAFSKLKDDTVRQCVIGLVKAMAAEQGKTRKR
jgi:transcriptional regulator with XRE-family HTH domain